MPTFRSNSSSSTTMTVNLVESGRSGTAVSAYVNWSVTLGSETSNGSSSSNNRTLYIYRSDGVLLGSGLIKNSQLWDNNQTYTGSFGISFDVGTLDNGGFEVYIQTNSSGTQSCIWTNRSYCTNFDFWWSLYFTGAGAPSNPRLSAGVFENGVTLLWNAASPGVNNAVHTYHVYYRINGGTEYGVDVGGNYTSYWLDTTGWGRGTRVDFHLAAITQRGDNPWSGWSGSAYKNNAPNTPTSASVAKTFYAPGETIRVSFTNNGDPDGNMLSVEVARGDNESTLWTNTAGASYVDVNTTGWTPGVPYQLHVRARDSFQVLSGWSNLTAVVMVGLPVFVQPAADGVFRRVVSMQVYVSDTVGFKTVKSMKIAPAQGEINKTVF